MLSQVVQICFVGPALCTNQELSYLLWSLYPCPAKSKFSNHCFMFAHPCSGFGNTKPSNKSRLNKWYRINISVPLNPHDGWSHYTCWPGHYYMRWWEDHTWGLMTTWSPDDMPWPCQWVITRGAMNKQTNVKSSNHATEYWSALSCNDCDNVGKVSTPTLHSTASRFQKYFPNCLITETKGKS